jgi:hypothetical protein
VASIGYGDDMDAMFGLTFANPGDDAPSCDAADPRFHEHWVQQYVKENFEHLGFDHIEGPYSQGPDYRARPRGTEALVEVEVEVRFRNYVKHGHHESRAFSKVGILIVLEEGEPPDDIRPHLPAKIIHVDRQHFVAWYENANRDYDYRRPEIQGVLQQRAPLAVIAGGFHGRWVEVCPHKERDMASCPDCDGCPYFGNGEPGEAGDVFLEMAIAFAESHYPNGIKLADVTIEEMDAFFADRLIGG